MILDRKQGEALLAVTETGSFEQAAARLHLTASAVSQRVRALEVQLGQPLVVRSRPCRATRAGQRLLRYLVRAALLDGEFLAETAAEQAEPLSVAIAVNADSLATWFLPALDPFLERERVLIDLIVDDQDHTYALLEAGRALGCVSTEPRPMRGCLAEPLGTMRYRALAAPAFRGRWFPHGMTPEAVRRAPVPGVQPQGQASGRLPGTKVPAPAQRLPLPLHSRIRALSPCPSAGVRLGHGAGSAGWRATSRGCARRIGT